MAIPGSGVGLPEYEIPPGLNCERVKGARLPAQMLWAPHFSFREGEFVGEPQVPATFERSAPAGSNSLAFPGSGAGLPGREIPPGLNCERVKGTRLSAQPSGVVRELIPPQGVWLIY